MIQRIQSLYLAISALIAFVLPFVFIKYQIGDEVVKVTSNLFQLLLLFVAGGIAAFAISKFQDRKTQVVLSRLAIIFHFISFIWLYTDFFFQKTEVNSSVNAGFGIYIPLLAIVFLVLANRAIMKDERLIREANRLR